jgi:hypothetical protein
VSPNLARSGKMLRPECYRSWSVLVFHVLIKKRVALLGLDRRSWARASQNGLSEPNNTTIGPIMIMGWSCVWA